MQWCVGATNTISYTQNDVLTNSAVLNSPSRLYMPVSNFFVVLHQNSIQLQKLWEIQFFVVIL